MLEFIQRIFKSDFLAHGYCYRWMPEIVWLHVLSDLFIAIAYYFIPFALIYIVRKRRDIVYPWMFVLFGVFILACGTTHLMSVWTVWQPVYRLDGIVKLITALASVPTAILLVRLAPAVIALPSPAQLREANQRLEHEITERKAAALQVQSLNDELEERVRLRTRELDDANERLRAYNAELEQFAYVAAHDLQEPLRTVRSYAGLVSKRYGHQIDDDGKEFLGYVTEGVERMSQLVAALQAYTDATHRGGDLTADLDLNEVLRKTLQMMKITIAESGCKVVAGVLPRVIGHRSQLGQLFQNLISNSIKYRSSEPPVIHIDAARKGSEWEFIVKDNGIGIDPKYHEQIFGVFKRLHGQEIAGTGIGLAIVKKIVEGHGGRVWLMSKLGEGTEIHFTLRD